MTNQHIITDSFICWKQSEDYHQIDLKEDNDDKGMYEITI